MNRLTADQRAIVETLADHFAHRQKSDAVQENISNIALDLASQIGTVRFQAIMLEALAEQCRGIAGRSVGATFLQATGGKTGIRGDQAKVINALSKRLTRELVMPQILARVAIFIPPGDFLESLIYTDAAKIVARHSGLIQVAAERMNDARRLARINDRDIALDQIDESSVHSDENEPSSQSDEQLELIENIEDQIDNINASENLDEYEDDSGMENEDEEANDNAAEESSSSSEEPSSSESEQPAPKRGKRVRANAEDEEAEEAFIADFKKGAAKRGGKY